MLSISAEIKTINFFMSKTQNRKSSVDKASEDFLKLNEIESKLLERLELLKTFADEINEQTETVEAEVKTGMDDLNGELKERIASIRHEYDDNAAELPDIPDVKLVVKNNSPSVLINTYKAIEFAVRQLRNQMLNIDVTSEDIGTAGKQIFELVQRRTLLKSNIKKMEDLIRVVKSEISHKIKNLQDQKKERIASIHDEYKNKVAELPKVEDFTILTVKKYIQKYMDDYKHIPVNRNFFHAAACSNKFKYVEVKSETAIENITNKRLPEDVQYPLLRMDVDKIIHSSKMENCYFVILDTSLRIIMTNLSKILSSPCYPRLLIFDSKSKQFAPLSWKTKDANVFCFACMRYRWTIHEFFCGRRCPFCLREGNAFRCFKPTLDSKPFICSTCNAFCQTKQCYNAHQKICPLPVQGTHDDALELIQSILNE